MTEKRLFTTGKCNKCGKVITHTYQIDTDKAYRYETENTPDRYIDNWGYARDYCKKCM